MAIFPGFVQNRFLFQGVGLARELAYMDVVLMQTNEASRELRT